MHNMAPPWRLVYVVLLLLEVLVGVHSQLDSNGFLSIDCGLAANTSYEEGTTKYTYYSDDQFIDTGINAEVSSSYIKDVEPNLPRAFVTLRYFPTGARNCYTLRNLTVGFKYLVRVTFIYGDYDNTNKPPIFDIHLGISFWDTIVTYPYYPEIIVAASTDYLQVCLINKGLGIPFISSLHLRQLTLDMYKKANSTQSLILTERTNQGPGNPTNTLSLYIRYPLDRYDRWWFSKDIPGTTEIATNSSIDTDPDFETPSLIMQSAATYSIIKDPISISWSSNSASTKFYAILHFAEIQNATSSRAIDIYSNGLLVPPAPYNFKWLKGEHVTTETSGYTRYNITIVADSNSTLPPQLNGYELYKIAPVVGVPTYSGDVTAINSIKEVHQIKKGWSGDPCVPKEYTWNGISCTSYSNDILRITALNLSSSGLSGLLSSYFGNLSALVSLDLSNNNLSGSLPNFLDQLIALTFLDISGNSKLSTTLPPGLQSKQQSGSLTYRFGEKILPPSPSSSSSRKKYIIIVVAVVAALLVIAVVAGALFRSRRKRTQLSIASKPHYISESSSVATVPSIVDHIAPQFSYNDLKKITYDFTNTIGTGGFGSVYFGRLENGYQVAVKMRSDQSTQGAKEFLAEAKNLARVHHKNLVALVGYCIDENIMALVYEYMQEGNLQRKLREGSARLTWKQRLRIGYESALGLEYLHEACYPPLIHRDVKTSNILLSANLEAKIADFGLSRAFTTNEITHVSTIVVGTTGYLDPEYYLYNRLTAKSDVYSFGVVLLEIVTGRPPIVGPDEGGLIEWVHQKKLDGNIESIVDQKMEGNYDINTIWRVINLACRCTERSSTGRPSMSVVVSELKECLNLERQRDGTSNNNSVTITDVSQNSALEMASLRDEQSHPSVR